MDFIEAKTELKFSKYFLIEYMNSVLKQCRTLNQTRKHQNSLVQFSLNFIKFFQKFLYLFIDLFIYLPKII